MLILIAVGLQIRPSGRLHIIWESLKKERQENSVILPRKRHFLAKFFSRKHKDEIDLTEAEALRVARAFGLEDTVRMSMRYVSPLNALYDWDLVDYDVLREMMTRQNDTMN